MKNQIAQLNSNIEQKNKKIKSVYKTIKKVRVFFLIQVYNSDKTELLFNSEELNKANQAKKLFNSPDWKQGSIVQWARIQTSGYVGGIILGGSREIVLEKTV